MNHKNNLLMFFLVFLCASKLSWTMSITDATTVWKAETEDYNEQLNFLENFHINNKTKKIQLIKQAYALDTFFFFAFTKLNNLIGSASLPITSKAGIRGFIEQTKQFQALLTLTDQALRCFQYLQVTPWQDLGPLKLFKSAAREIGLGFITVDDRVIPYPFALKEKLWGLPLTLVDERLFQLYAATLNGNIVTDYGFFVDNKAGMPLLSIYTGQFGPSPFSLSRFSLTPPSNLSFDEFCREHNAVIATDKSFAFIPLYANTVEQLGFSFELYNNLQLLESQQSEGGDYDVTELLITESDDPDLKQSDNHVDAQVDPALEELIRNEQEAIRLQVINHTAGNKPPKQKKSKQRARQQKRSKHARNETQAGVDQEVLAQCLTVSEALREQHQRGRVKFRKFSRLINELIASEKCIISDQRGSHITLRALNCEPMTIVKNHGHHDTISANEANTALEKIIQMVATSQKSQQKK